MIQAKVVAHSKNPQGDELLTVLCTFPRHILAEVNTHRMLSKNSASSRAIPTKRMLEIIENNPFIPIAWQKEHKGMQGSEYITEKEYIDIIKDDWLEARNSAMYRVKRLINFEDNSNVPAITKQMANRLLEPFMWHTALITGSVNKEGWLNFFELRCPQYEISLTPDDSIIATGKSWKDLMNWKGDGGISAKDSDTNNIIERLSYNKGQAEIHMMALAEAIWDAWKESTPKQLEADEWHIPFKDKINSTKLLSFIKETRNTDINHNRLIEQIVKISTAMAARTSYTVVGDEKEVSYETLLGIHDKMAVAKPFHASPFEHCARAMSDIEYEDYIKGVTYNTDGLGWCRNYRGFIQYRHLIESSNQ